MRTINHEIIDLVKRENIPSNHVNVFWSLFALMSTGEILPIRCGEKQGDWLCPRCCVSIVSNWEKIKSVPNAMDQLGLTFHHYESGNPHRKKFYHWRKLKS
jgi:hypothetical protein